MLNLYFGTHRNQAEIMYISPREFSEYRVTKSDQRTSSIVAEIQQGPLRSPFFWQSFVVLQDLCYNRTDWVVIHHYGQLLHFTAHNVILDTNVMERSADRVLFGFGLFLSQYLLAGALYIYGFDEVAIFASTMLLAGFGFAVLDGTGASMVIGTLIAGAGPMAEEMLLPAFQGLEEQVSVSADITAPVYFLGSSVCGNTARAVWMITGSTEDTGKPVACREGAYTMDRPRCLVCRDTRAVECTVCNAIGFTISSDGYRRRCEVCNGRGLVFCKQCACLYGDDPKDTARIEEIMRRIPD